MHSLCTIWRPRVKEWRNWRCVPHHLTVIYIPLVLTATARNGYTSWLFWITIWWPFSFNSFVCMHIFLTQANGYDIFNECMIIEITFKQTVDMRLTQASFVTVFESHVKRSLLGGESTFLPVATWILAGENWTSHYVSFTRIYEFWLRFVFKIDWRVFLDCITKKNWSTVYMHNYVSCIPHSVTQGVTIRPLSLSCVSKV